MFFFFYLQKLFFSKADLCNLALVPKEESKDSTFIFMALEAAYKDNPEAYGTRSVTGRSKNQKKLATPEKIKSVKDEFQRRIAKLNLSDSAYDARYNSVRINRLLNSAFQNLSRKYRCSALELVNEDKNEMTE